VNDLSAAMLAALALCRHRTYRVGECSVTGVRGRTLARAANLDIGIVNGACYSLAQSGLVAVHEADDEYIYALTSAGRAALAQAAVGGAVEGGSAR
jgi:DNA-binding MarR family transcriptional regulator